MAHLPWTRWHLAGLLRRWLPDVRGRDRLHTMVSGSGVPTALRDGDTCVRFGPGLQATVPIGADGSFVDVFFAAYEDPVLVPILEAVLAPGACFYDIGANIGLYSLWASRLVGPAGTVVAFEPVPHTRGWLEALVAENDAAVTILPVAVSDRAGEVTIETIPEASGRSRVVPASALAGGGAVEVDRRTADAPEHLVTVRTATLDEVARDLPWPTLVKIDVEGHELSVFRGMTETLTQAQPAVVFECPDTVGADGDTAKILVLLSSLGYEVWSLTTAGLRRAQPGAVSHNLLALHPDRHEAVRAELQRHHFRRNQNC